MHVGSVAAAGRENHAVQVIPAAATTAATAATLIAPIEPSHCTSREGMFGDIDPVARETALALDPGPLPSVKVEHVIGEHAPAAVPTAPLVLAAPVEFDVEAPLSALGADVVRHTLYGTARGGSVSADIAGGCVECDVGEGCAVGADPRGWRVRLVCSGGRQRSAAVAPTTTVSGMRCPSEATT